MSPFSHATSGVSYWATYGALTAQNKIYYGEWLKETVSKNISISESWPLEIYDHLLEDISFWLLGNSFTCFTIISSVSNQPDMKSPVYASSFTVTTTLNT